MPRFPAPTIGTGTITTSPSPERPAITRSRPFFTRTDLRRLGGVTLDSPATYESTIPAGFHTFDVGKLSASPTFTLGDETAFPAFSPVSENHPKHVVGAAFFYYFLVDYTAENGFLFHD